MAGYTTTTVLSSQDHAIQILRKTRKRLDELMSDLCRMGPMTEARLRRTVMERYGLSSGESRYLIELAEKADAAAVDADKQALKEEFTYRSHQHDVWEILLTNLDRPFFAPLEITGIPRLAAEGFVTDCYYEKGALEVLATRYAGWEQWDAEEFGRLLPLLEEAQRFDLIERLCTSVARRARARFIKRFSQKGSASEAWLEKLKEYALEAHDRATDWLTRIGHPEAVQRLAEQREEVVEGRVPAPPPISESRPMDEPVFWDVLRRSREQAETPDDQIAVLEALLPAFRAPDIKRFGSLYASNMRRLYHWNVWALGYAARDGCSDDSFMEFRTWLILQGDPALIDLAIANPAEAARRVPRDPDLPGETLLALIEDSYLKRKGAPMALPLMDHSRPRGREWPEEQLEQRYPELVRYYRSVEACLAPADPL